MPWFRSLLALALLCGTAAAADWPQWLGPKRDATSSEKVEPWKGDLKVVWRQPVGEGHSSPVVADGVVYLHYKLAGQDAEALQAFDARTGKPLWQASYPRGAYKGLFGSGPRATPAVAGGRVFTHGITGLVTCFDAKKGEQLWQKDTQKELKAPKLFFGSSSSPLVIGDRVVVMVGAKGAGLVAFNARDGGIGWKSLDDGATYSSPVVLGRQPQLVALTKQRLVGLNPADGSLYWGFPLVDKLAESSSTPVIAGGLLVASSITYGSVGLKMEEKDQKPAVEKVWFKEELNSYFSTPVGVGDQLYIVTATRPPAVATAATLRCVDPTTGKELWSRPNVGKYHASLLRTADNKLLLLEEAGDLVLMEPDAKAYRELARAKICGNTWAHPALSDGRIYIRDSKELICVQVAQ
jgi:outer membrane protein assembly factor BamB